MLIEYVLRNKHLRDKKSRADNHMVMKRIIWQRDLLNLTEGELGPSGVEQTDQSVSSGIGHRPKCAGGVKRL